LFISVLSDEGEAELVQPEPELSSPLKQAAPTSSPKDSPTELIAAVAKRALKQTAKEEEALKPARDPLELTHFRIQMKQKTKAVAEVPKASTSPASPELRVSEKTQSKVTLKEQLKPKVRSPAK